MSTSANEAPAAQQGAPLLDVRDLIVHHGQLRALSGIPDVRAGRCGPVRCREVTTGPRSRRETSSGLSAPARAKIVNTPELKEIRNGTTLYVFAL